MPTQRPSKGGPVPKGSRTGGLITMSGRRTEVNKHQIRWSLTKTHKDLSTRYWLLERACEPDQVPARPGPGLIPRPEHQPPQLSLDPNVQRIELPDYSKSSRKPCLF